MQVRALLCNLREQDDARSRAFDVAEQEQVRQEFAHRPGDVAERVLLFRIVNVASFAASDADTRSASVTRIDRN